MCVFFVINSMDKKKTTTARWSTHFTTRWPRCDIQLVLRTRWISLRSAQLVVKCVDHRAVVVFSYWHTTMLCDHLSVMTVAIWRLLCMYSVCHYRIHQWRRIRIIWKDQIYALFAIDAWNTTIKYLAHNLAFIRRHDCPIIDYKRMWFHMRRFKSMGCNW